MCVSGANESGSDWKRASALVESLEGSTECLYNRLPRQYNTGNEVTEFTHKEQNQLHRLCDSPDLDTAIRRQHGAVLAEARVVAEELGLPFW